MQTIVEPVHGMPGSSDRVHEDRPPAAK
jgi:hypothetical protein